MAGDEEQVAERIAARVGDLVATFADDPNPPLAVWRAVVGRDPGGSGLAALDRLAAAHLVRQEVVRRWSWAVPDDAAVEMVVRHAAGRPVVEVAAGTGWWARLLADRGVEIHAYDAAPPPATHAPVSRGGPEAAGRHPDAVLLLSWPPHRSPAAAEAVAAYLAAGGTTVVYVGEGRGGWTAADDLFDLLDEFGTEVERVALPSWPGYDDSLAVYTLTPLQA